MDCHKLPLALGPAIVAVGRSASLLTYLLPFSPFLRLLISPSVAIFVGPRSSQLRWQAGHRRSSHLQTYDLQPRP